MSDRLSSASWAKELPPSRSPASQMFERVAGDIQREMISAWQTGAPIQAERWLDLHPQMKAEPELAAMVIYEELCLREERGERVESAEIYGRFPQYREALSVLLSCHRLMHTEPARFPEAGEEFGEFRLLRELGRGGAGRVFLALQPALSDRPLVVKLTPRTGEEHLSLARLQHTHIVPLFLVQEFPERNIRALCMPFLGGATWSRILHALHARGAGRLSGATIAQVLAAEQHELDPTANSSGPAIGFLEQASYEQAVCWIGSCLADALHYAHQRGLLHLDIKPSNVLLASDGQPMLLDFHLAHEVRQTDQQRADRVGGTPGYMSPEQQSCVQALRAGRPVPVALDPRSDIYSLGVLLYESLTGRSPPGDDAESRGQLRGSSLAVSRGLEDLLHKCLAPARDSRYVDAGELALDLRRHIAHLPLRGVANRSLRERWQKWRRRKPHSLGTWAVGLVALVVIGCATWFYYQDRLQLARAALDRAEQDLARGDHADALERLSAGLQAVRWLPGQQSLRQTLQSRLVAARGARVAGALHQLVEQLRFLDNVADVPPQKLRELDAGCRAIWKARGEIAGAQAADFTGQPAREALDLLDLALLWTRLVTRNAPADRLPQERSQALAVLDEAQAMWGSSPALAFAREQLGGNLDPADAQAARRFVEHPRTAWEHDAVGRSWLQAGKLDEARRMFDAAVGLEPDAFWPHFHLALCEYRRQRFDEALRSADVCVALSPRAAECYFNRAQCLVSLARNEEALRDLNRALELDPTLGAAAYQRGVLLADEGRSAEALQDFGRAVELGGDPARIFYRMASIAATAHDWPAARKYVEQSLAHDATYAPALVLENRLKARADAADR